MRENIIQTGKRGADGRTYIENDWYKSGISPNAVFGDHVYLDTSYGFASFHSKQNEGLFMEEASGCYDIVSFITSGNGKIKIGEYSIINGATIICNNEITIGKHCMVAWGAVISDNWFDAKTPSIKERSELLKNAANDPQRKYPFCKRTAPVVLEDNCWVGFGAVILPGVTLGEGSVVASKTVVSEDVPPYAVVAGSPARIVKFLR